jgi:hypothetical protein
MIEFFVLFMVRGNYIMLIQDKFRSARGNRGLSGALLTGESNYNEMWGPDYQVFIGGVQNESVMILLVDEMLMMREMELQ